jgi:hypothetical protein
MFSVVFTQEHNGVKVGDEWQSRGRIEDEVVRYSIALPAII